ncbi:dihydrodipicolinate synthase family protein [Thermofilum pendens]|uniref:Dihydrodipicolinate synthase n=1 Tax=Thermofilum pendens (strain DSM 2475 / Hrk 5) TaxID=368408 RepID=A1S0N5_THEPD|nr:dihydrodipicolinate synthase family protein [Thermofilum pendens]ABL79015.1 dihydrodipicolinate synthase [Thermofilum pendens Hrk 5]
MPVTRLYGIIPPLITPFDTKGNLSVDRLSGIVEFTKPYVHGYYLCGTYGLGPLMRTDQRKKVAERVAELVGGEKLIVVHVGSADTETAVELAKHAQDIGAHAVASVPPFYYHHSETHILNFFRELVDSVSIPVYAYNNPPRVGYPITPELALKLKEVGVAGIKDSSFDVQAFIDYKVTLGEDFDVVVGTEALMLPTYVLGARAFIPGMSNYAPEIVFKLFKALENRDFENAAKIQYKINKVRRQVQRLGPTIPLVYLALKLRGVDAGFPRKPFLPAPHEVQEILKSYIEELLEGVET